MKIDFKIIIKTVSMKISYYHKIILYYLLKSLSNNMNILYRNYY